MTSDYIVSLPRVQKFKKYFWEKSFFNPQFKFLAHKKSVHKRITIAAYLSIYQEMHISHDVGLKTQSFT